MNEQKKKKDRSHHDQRATEALRRTTSGASFHFSNQFHHLN